MAAEALNLSIKAWAEAGSNNVRNLTATIPTSPARVVGDVVLVGVVINPGVPDTVAGPAGWREQNTSFFGGGFALGKVFTRPWAAGVTNPAFSWATRCQAGYKTVVVSGASGLPPNNVSVATQPNTGPAPAPTVQTNADGSTDVVIVANLDATTTVRIGATWLPIAGSSRTGHGAHGHAG